MAEHCKTCRCDRGVWTVEVSTTSARVRSNYESRDEAVLMAQQEVANFAPVDSFHEKSITVTFGGSK